ncbi:MAG: hypothetical protein JNL65_07675 [Saprospiraceae bacterium]|nr:hypothetical protein [Saprospiraceae bacterium]
MRQYWLDLIAAWFDLYRYQDPLWLVAIIQHRNTKQRGDFTIGNQKPIVLNDTAFIAVNEGGS